jgi:FdhE protein
MGRREASAPRLTTEVFEKRLLRAQNLSRDWPFAEEILRTYCFVAEFQRQLSRDPGRSGLGQDLGTLSPVLHRPLEALLERLAGQAPPALAREAAAWRGRVADRWASEAAHPNPEAPSILYPFLRQVLEQVQLPIRNPDPGVRPSPEAGGVCPSCSRLPLAAILREDVEAQSLRRTLLCSGCSREWDFPRVLCPACREEQPEKLPRYGTPEIPWIRIEGCESCWRYLKSVDLTQCPQAEPYVDELASIPLDLIAQERGHTKLSVNLAGL